MKIAIFAHCISEAEQYQRNLCIAKKYNSLTIRRLTVDASPAKSRDIPRNFELIAGQGHTSSSTLVPIGAICNFLLVVNSNAGRISYRAYFFRDNDA